MVPGLSSLTHEERLERMKLPSLAFCRIRWDAIEAYKYLHFVYRVRSDYLLLMAKETVMTTRGHGLKRAKRECSYEFEGELLRTTDS
jgi:hypothetical protein